MTKVLSWQTHVCHKKHVCCDKTHLLSQQKYACRIIILLWQNYVCCDNIFVMTKTICHDKHVFVVTKLCLSRQKWQIRLLWQVLLWQAYLCHNERCILSQLTCVYHDKSKLVTTKHLLWQNYVCRDNYLSEQKFCHNKNRFVATKVLSRQAYFCHNKRHVLSRQKLYLWQLPPMTGQGTVSTMSYGRTVDWPESKIEGQRGSN